MIFVGAHFINSYQFLLEMLEVKLYENDGSLRSFTSENWTQRRHGPNDLSNQPDVASH